MTTEKGRENLLAWPQAQQTHCWRWSNSQVPIPGSLVGRHYYYLSHLCAQGGSCAWAGFDSLIFLRGHISDSKKQSVFSSFSYLFACFFLKTLIYTKVVHEKCSQAFFRSYNKNSFMPRAGGLHNRNVFPHSSGGWKFEIKALAGLFLLGPLSLACTRPPSLCVSSYQLLFTCLSQYSNFPSS